MPAKVLERTRRPARHSHCSPTNRPNPAVPICLHISPCPASLRDAGEGIVGNCRPNLRGHLNLVASGPADPAVAFGRVCRKHVQIRCPTEETEAVLRARAPPLVCWAMAMSDAPKLALKMLHTTMGSVGATFARLAIGPAAGKSVARSFKIVTKPSHAQVFSGSNATARFFQGSGIGFALGWATSRLGLSRRTASWTGNEGFCFSKGATVTPRTHTGGSR